MIYLARLRLKDSATVADFPKINQQLDEAALPALRKSEGVQAAQAYNSIHGDIVIIIDLDNLIALDRILGTREIGEAIAPLLQWTVRVGPADVMYDRGPYQALYSG